MPTIPTCAKANAPGTTAGDYLKGLHTFASAQPGDYALEHVLGGAAPTSLILRHSDGHQICVRESGGTLLTLIDPDGAITDSAAPNPSAGASPEDVLIPSPSGSSVEMLWAMYGDAFVWIVKNSAKTACSYAVHPGRIHVPHDASDAARGLDGLGVLAYLPHQLVSSSAGRWWTTNSTGSNRLSHVRVGATAWADPTLARAPQGISQSLVGRRFVPLEMVADDLDASSGASSPGIGMLKYIRGDTGAQLSPFAVVPSPSTNQAMLAIDDSAGTTRLRCLWNKTVTP